jgi:hypothetical protein
VLAVLDFGKLVLDDDVLQGILQSRSEKHVVWVEVEYRTYNRKAYSIFETTYIVPLCILPSAW